MADNALGTLFSHIADAIRSKTGNIGTMKPNDFPANILAISQIINNSGGETENPDSGASSLKINSGMFRTEEVGTGVQTIEHGLGTVPDFVMVYSSGISSEFWANGSVSIPKFAYAYGYHSSFANRLENHLGVVNFTIGFQFTTAQGIDQSGETVGFVTNSDSEKFIVGYADDATDGKFLFDEDGDYYWIAMSGLGSTGVSETILENLPIALDLSNGNMNVNAPEGYLVKSAIIQKPDTLVPENIAKDVNIAGVVGTLEPGGGSGGGSLPTGAYWETLDILFKNNYTQQWFEFNGNLYALIGTVAGSGALGGIYQYSNGSWTQIGSSFSNVNAGASSSKLQEYNGKLHLFPSETTKHIVFDGTNITVMNELPNRVYLHPSFVQDGLLKFYSYYDGSIYVWDESSDTWTKESTVGTKYDYYYFFNVNGAVYAYLLKKIYTYNNGVRTQVGTITDSIFGVTVFENKIFYTSSQNGNSSHKIWCYDPTNNTERRVGTVPHWNGYSTLFVYNGKLCVLNSGIANSNFAASALHEVTE